MVMEFILAATASTSAIAMLSYWSTALGKPIWQAATITAALAGVVKPLLKLPDKIKNIEEIATGFKVLEYDLQKLIVRIHQRRAFSTDDALCKDFSAIVDRQEALFTRSAENKIYKKLKQQCERETMQELPVERFYIPIEGDSNV